MSSTGPGLGGHVRPRLTVVSGPSGVGKSSVLTEVRRRLPDVYFSVSVTTRRPRPGEVDGVHYHFVDAETFQHMADEGELLEQAEYAGNRYGTPRGPVQRALDQGRPALLEIELQGARQVRAAMPEAQLVMLVPPSWDELVTRLTRRGTEDPVVVARRLELARQELAAADEFDAVVVNTDVLAAADELVTLVVGQGPGAATRPSGGAARGAPRTRRG